MERRSYANELSPFSLGIVGRALSVVVMPLGAQWTNYRTPGIPRTKDGTPKRAAPAPRTADGKSDFSGIRQVSTAKYLANLGDRWGSRLRSRPGRPSYTTNAWRTTGETGRHGRDRPSGHCLPNSVTDFDAHFMPKKLIETPGLFVMLFESYHSYRQIFTDERPLPTQPDPGWFGYWVGQWEGDTLVANTIGINEKTGLDDSGHPHSDALRVIERLRAPRLGAYDGRARDRRPKGAPPRLGVWRSRGLCSPTRNCWTGAAKTKRMWSI
jgi:hypothetical protein